ncbi:MAG: ferrous iron transport protein A [Actinobacteria bacterium]|nr:ferrous iron transport protein A [Actinomycetota bacterium]
MRSYGKPKRGRHRSSGRGPDHHPGVHYGKTVRLGDLDPGCTGRIASLSCQKNLRRRLMNMGVVCGTPFEISRVAPLGDPIELKFKDFNISLRKEEAGDIWVEVLNDER